MPVALNTPPFPTADAVNAAGHESGADTAAQGGDVFAQLLRAAGAPFAPPGKIDVETTGGRPSGTAPAASAADRDKPAADFFALVQGVGLPGADTAAVPGTKDPAKPGGPDDAMLGATPLADSGMAPPALAVTMAAPFMLAAMAARDTASPAQTGTDAPQGMREAQALRAPALSASGLNASALNADERHELASTSAAVASDAGHDGAAAAAGASRDGLPEWRSLLVGAMAKTEKDPDLATAPVAAPANHGLAAASRANVVMVDAPVASGQWNTEIADQVGQLVIMRRDHAEFQLHPRELGPMDVSIRYVDQQAIVTITAAHPQTRDALEQALPQLRDMLASQGIALGDVNVQAETRSPPEPQPRDRGSFAAADKAPIAAVAVPMRLFRGDGSVDVFA